MSVILWRIGVDTPDYTAEDTAGKGAEITGGRWNRKGSPVVYTSQSIALACLETVVHLGSNGLPLNRYLVEITVPQAAWDARIDLDPAAHVGWDAIPEGKVSLDAGEAWLTTRSALLFTVPSVVVPEERNVLINPRHPESALVVARKIRRWTYDPRLKK